MKVIMATDGSKIARDALEWYMQTLHKDENQLYIVHVTDNRYSFETKDPVIPADQHLFVLGRQEEDKKAKAVVKEMESFLLHNKIHGEVNRLFGDVGEEIVKRAACVNASLIITGSRGLGVIRRTVLGSVSDYVVQHANIPVIVFKDKSFKSTSSIID
ncbi:stress response protein NhaX-like [Ostrea edulis]|uniref:stress response protein NhaX-like n=1 Tax=Ostrea edulis TaxID=37623 RepID=UPI0024AF9C6C|nr:stress response protein NhaX-like [Ostrea edulis]